MLVEKARDHFLGKNGCRRLNCAQAVVATFKDKFRLPEHMIDEYASFGVGKAPQGECGAFYAARSILEAINPEKFRQHEERLIAQLGSLTCRDIRSSRKLSCVGCVEKAAEFLAGE